VAALPAAACFDAQAGLPAAKLTKQLRLFREARGLPFEHQAAAGSRRVRENDGEAAADELERVMEALERAYGQRDEPVGEIEFEELLLWPPPPGEAQPTYASVGRRGNQAGVRCADAMRLSAYVCELAGRGGGLEAGALAAELERLAGALALQAPKAEWAKQHALPTCPVRALAFFGPPRALSACWLCACHPRAPLPGCPAPLARLRPAAAVRVTAAALPVCPALNPAARRSRRRPRAAAPRPQPPLPPAARAAHRRALGRTAQYHCLRAARRQEAAAGGAAG
jgi:hypothetical protein